MRRREQRARRGLEKRPNAIFLMCDWHADPLWFASDGRGADIDELPLGGETRSWLERWAEEWNRLADAALHGEGEDAGAEEASDRHRAEGDALWTRLREDLGADWHVGRATFPPGGGFRVIAWSPEELEDLRAREFGSD